MTVEIHACDCVYYPHRRADGSLVADPRLQAIADAWNAASTSRHGGFAVRLSFPELAALLDALLKEES